jgi:hypothetical protein
MSGLIEQGFRLASCLQQCGRARGDETRFSDMISFPQNLGFEPLWGMLTPEWSLCGKSRHVPGAMYRLNMASLSVG